MPRFTLVRAPLRAEILVTPTEGLRIIGPRFPHLRDQDMASGVGGFGRRVIDTGAPVTVVSSETWRLVAAARAILHIGVLLFLAAIREVIGVEMRVTPRTQLR